MSRPWYPLNYTFIWLFVHWCGLSSISICAGYIVVDTFVWQFTSLWCSMMNNMDNDIKERNYITDKNRVENANKYIYAKFPTFDTHKKVKKYNNKISELTLENEKLKRYKNDLEKKIIEEGGNFEVNFKKYEIAISNALRIGYACSYLCNILNKIIDKSKKNIFWELIRRRDNFKNSLIKSYISKNSFGKLFINSMVMKIDDMYEKNRNFVVMIFVRKIKRKIRSILYLFMKNVFNLAIRKVNSCSSILVSDSDNYHHHRLFPFNRSSLSHVDRKKKVLGFEKLLNALRNNLHRIFKCCFLILLMDEADDAEAKGKRDINYSMKDNSNWGTAAYDYDDCSDRGLVSEATGKGKQNKLIDVGKLSNMRITGNGEMEEMRKKGKGKYDSSGRETYTKGVNVNGEVPFEKKEAQFEESENDFLCKKNNYRNNLQEESFNMQNDNSSTSSYLPHPNEVYNYLYYRELSKLRKKIPENFVGCEKYSDLEGFLNYMEANGEVYCLRGGGTLNTIGGGGYGNIPSKSEKTEESNNVLLSNNYTQMRKEGGEEGVVRPISSSRTKLFKSPGSNFVDKENMYEERFINMLMLYENNKVSEVLERKKGFSSIFEEYSKYIKWRESVPSGEGAESVESGVHAGESTNSAQIAHNSSELQKTNFYQQDEQHHPYECAENMLDNLQGGRKVGNIEKVNNVHKSANGKENSQHFTEMKREGYHINVDTRLPRKVNYGMVKGKKEGEKDVGNCEYEMESYANGENTKAKMSFYSIENEFRSMISQMSGNYNESGRQSISVEKENLYGNEIENIKPRNE
ncbi:conserved Plasmodium protein, unknown function [Plasmodium ovale wallikeri]|uniref:Uncharacterized protein n=1 Tax=Plasmodium ovale wallikeri TaxID=864142 RepID=A0A1A8YWZ2_PLAOA|nr:conserved Plasmodium protein, unknown function [Plasmodium ovale wallikeri]SBT36226.1 conserved Plasmodium protein, unknown function [Plasmodium ovale wallikeri]